MAERKEPDLSDPSSEAFSPVSDEPAPAPQPVEDGELTHKAKEHEHRYQTFNVSGKREELCPVCLRKKGSRG